MTTTSRDSTLVIGDVNLDARQKQIRVAHGVIMAVVFIALKPAGAVLLRVVPGRLGFKIHVGWQMAAIFIATAGVAMGIYLAKIMERFGDAHPIVGLVVMGLFIIQPQLGYMHHRIFRKTHQRTYWGIVHVWVGRTLLLLGIINGGLGLEAADNSKSGKIAYGVLAGVGAVAYVLLGFSLKGCPKRRPESDGLAESKPQQPRL